MSCQVVGAQQQTEFEFFQDMLGSSNVLDCCGPITEIGFTNYSISQFKKCLNVVGVGDKHLDSYAQEVLDSGNKSLKMCAKHWLHYVEGVGSIALQTRNEEWETLAYTMFRVTCLTNNWDYREIMNYASTRR